MSERSEHDGIYEADKSKIHYELCPVGVLSPGPAHFDACNCFENLGARDASGTPVKQVRPFDEAVMRAAPGPVLPPLEMSGDTGGACLTCGFKLAHSLKFMIFVCDHSHGVEWCPACYATDISPEDCQLSLRVLCWLQQQYPIIPRKATKAPLLCRACGAPYHVEHCVDPAGQAWIALCLACGEYEMEGRVDYLETVLADLVKELKPEFRNRTFWQRLRARARRWFK